MRRRFSGTAKGGVMQAMMKVVLLPEVAGNVKRLTLTLVQPPFPVVGQRLRYLDSWWIVSKTTKTKGTILKTQANA